MPSSVRVMTKVESEGKRAIQNAFNLLSWHSELLTVDEIKTLTVRNENAELAIKNLEKSSKELAVEVNRLMKLIRERGRV